MGTEIGGRKPLLGHYLLELSDFLNCVKTTYAMVTTTIISATDAPIKERLFISFAFVLLGKVAVSVGRFFRKSAVGFRWV